MRKISEQWSAMVRVQILLLICSASTIRVTRLFLITQATPCLSRSGGSLPFPLPLGGFQFFASVLCKSVIPEEKINRYLSLQLLELVLMYVSCKAIMSKSFL